MASPTSTQLPSRATTNMSEDAVPEVDPTSTAGLLSERLQAWKHAVAYLEEYVEAVEKIHKAQAKEYEKALKTISKPLREGHHFDQSLGGVAGFFENIRANTQAMVNTNIETEKAIKTSVLTVLDRLHKEIKAKAKEFASGTSKGAKEVERARNATQKHIELLGQHTATYESAGGRSRLSATDDPYVVKRGVLHRLHKQVMEENGHRNDLIGVQNSFHDFESHIIRVLQQAIEAFTQLAGGQGDKQRALYADMLGAAQRVPHDLEWTAFVARSRDRLVDPNEPPRSVEAIAFPNMDHAGARPLVEGSLERKSRNKLSWGHQAGYYVVTPSGYLHEFKDTDDSRHDPKPELSVHLPGALVGGPSGDKFSVKGKDTSKTLSSKLSGSSELSFKAHSAADAERWYKVIKECASTSGAASPTSPTGGESPMSPLSPAATKDDKAEEPAAQETGVTGKEKEGEAAGAAEATGATGATGATEGSEKAAAAAASG